MKKELQPKKIAVTGAGQMGAQIAIQAALAGHRVALHDIDRGQLDRALHENRPHLDRRVAKGRITQEAAAAAWDRLSSGTSLVEAVGDADFVIEAVVEKLEVKRDVFRRLDELCLPHTVLATNSSYIGNSQLAKATDRGDRVLNMHFFYPPLVMKLVEVVKGEATSQATLDAAAELAREMDKVPVILYKELPGFLVNRILRAIVDEAYFLLEGGVASFADIDTACELGLNHPLGPFKLGDFSGLDIGYENRMAKFDRTGDLGDRPPASLARRVERGDLGRKTGRGFYDYSTKPPTPSED